MMSPKRLLVTMTSNCDGSLHQEHRQRVDVEMTCLDVRILRLHLREHALPQRVALRHGVALVRHADTRQAACPRELERVPDDPIHALVGVDLFLNRDLVRRARLEAPADAGVQPLGVLAKHDEVDVGGPRPFNGHNRSSSRTTGR